MKVPTQPGGTTSQSAPAQQGPSPEALLMAAVQMNKDGKPPIIFGQGGNPSYPPLKPIDPEAWKAYGTVTGQKSNK